MNTALYLYLDIETIPSQDPTILDSIIEKHAVPLPDLSCITAAANLKDPDKIVEDIAKRRAKAQDEHVAAVAKAKAVVDEEYRNTALDGTLGHISCASIALAEGSIEHVENTVLRLTPGKPGDIDGSKVWDAVQDGRLDVVIDYCAGDVERLRCAHRRLRRPVVVDGFERWAKDIDLTPTVVSLNRADAAREGGVA